jgi:hypothetical protein
MKPQPRAGRMSQDVAYGEMVDATIGSEWGASGHPPRRGSRPGDRLVLTRRRFAGCTVEEGMAVAVLAARLGVVTQTAHNWLVAADVAKPATPATVPVDVSDVEVRRLYALEGWTAVEVAAHLGCGTSTVYARLQSLGVARQPVWPGAAPGLRTRSSGACTWKLASASSPSGSR